MNKKKGQPPSIWTNYVPDERDELIDDVQRGRLTPEEAEASAKERALSPLVQLPNLSEFDPSKEVYWSLPMVIAWVATRRMSEVRFQFDKYRSHHHYWSAPTPWVDPKGHQYDGHFLCTLEKARISTLLEWGGGSPNLASQEELTAFTTAKNELWTALQSDKLHASGIRSSSQVREPICATDWIDLDDVADKGEATRIASERTLVRYDCVLVRRDEVLNQWPARGVKVQPVKKRRIPSKELAVQTAIVNLWPDGIPTTLSVGDRNKLIWTHMLKDNNFSKPASFQAFEQLIRRTVKKIEAERQS